MTASVTSLLKPIIVRVSANGVSGTGFFVAPGLVLTCAHITCGRAGDRVVVRWLDSVLDSTILDQRPEGGEGPGGLFPYPDLCLIRVPGDIENPCALLALEQPALETRLHSRGFTTTWSPLATEEPGGFTYDGPHEVEGGVLLKLSSGEAVPGMSGAPLVDLQRGVVCGVLKTSRALNTDRGGWGIPVTAIADVFPAVLEANRAYHEAHDSWRNVAYTLRQQDISPLTVDIGSITEVTRSGRPARVLFTITNSSTDRIKVPAITLDLLEAVQLPEPHHFRAEGLPQHYTLEAHLTPDQDRYELLDLHHVLEPGETEGYILRITAQEGFRYLLRLSVSWWRLGDEERQTWVSPPFGLSFRIMSTEGLLAAIRQMRDADDESR